MTKEKVVPLNEKLIDGSDCIAYLGRFAHEHHLKEAVEGLKQADEQTIVDYWQGKIKKSQLLSKLSVNKENWFGK